MDKSLIKEYYELRNTSILKTKNGKGFQLVYVDPNASTDSTFDNKELMKKYHMEYLPFNRYIKNVRGVPKAWGWLVWEGSENEVYPFIKRFASEIGSQETPIEGEGERDIEQVLSSIESLKDVIMKASTEVKEFDGRGVIANAEEFKKKLAFGIGSKETMDALAELSRFRAEMAKHKGHTLSFLNTIMVFFQKRNATDVRSKGEWKKMGSASVDEIIFVNNQTFFKLTNIYNTLED